MEKKNQSVENLPHQLRGIVFVEKKMSVEITNYNLKVRIKADMEIQAEEMEEEVEEDGEQEECKKNKERIGDLEGHHHSKNHGISPTINNN